MVFWPYLCAGTFSLVTVAEWPFFGEGAAHSIDRLFSLYFDYL